MTSIQRASPMVFVNGLARACESTRASVPHSRVDQGVDDVDEQADQTTAIAKIVMIPCTAP